MSKSSMVHTKGQCTGPGEALVLFTGGGGGGGSPGAVKTYPNSADKPP